MSLSVEAIISIVGVLINIPPAALLLWNLGKRNRSKKTRVSGEDAERKPSEQTGSTSGPSQQNVDVVIIFQAP
ncbi:hypothetical protein QBC33DRAFT_545069 [Phialemonium atrogriseum]|uniref:Uncharacterized protein n=1 Tax=Phialemonium atrogriseum TaxID=1093897 RepID=A0AAJ0BY90_9PEZI|nr:uncharacterized protein QBC33DRAFT_545069 [Phialemonium atrogriseum]KAK1765277.1 hypothetical protein QBC33DRAFT_545069 [Phialemonium atrogriseum]